METKTEKPMIKLVDYIKAKIAASRDKEFIYLPLCHTTAEGYFSQIFDGAKLKPSECKVYKEPLTYFFYGKSSYVVDPDNLGNVDRERPIALLYDFDELKKNGFKRVLPFDSGGFPRYDFPTGTSTEPFTILESKNGDEVQDLIQLIYKSHGKYLKDDFSESSLKQGSNECWAIKMLAEFYHQRVKPKSSSVGKQAVTIELQVAQEITIKPIAIIFPFELLTETYQDIKPYWSKEKIEASFPNVDFITYGEPDEFDSSLSDGIDVEGSLRKKVKKKSREHAKIKL